MIRHVCQLWGVFAFVAGCAAMGGGESHGKYLGDTLQNPDAWLPEAGQLVGSSHFGDYDPAESRCGSLIISPVASLTARHCAAIRHLSNAFDVRYPHPTHPDVDVLADLIMQRASATDPLPKFSFFEGTTWDEVLNFEKDYERRYATLATAMNGGDSKARAMSGRDLFENIAGNLEELGPEEREAYADWFRAFRPWNLEGVEEDIAVVWHHPVCSGFPRYTDGVPHYRMHRESARVEFQQAPQAPFYLAAAYGVSGTRELRSPAYPGLSAQLSVSGQRKVWSPKSLTTRKTVQGRKYIEVHNGEGAACAGDSGSSVMQCNVGQSLCGEQTHPCIPKAMFAMRLMPVDEAGNPRSIEQVTGNENPSEAERLLFGQCTEATAAVDLEDYYGFILEQAKASCSALLAGNIDGITENPCTQTAEDPFRWCEELLALNP